MVTLRFDLSQRNGQEIREIDMKKYDLAFDIDFDLERGLKLTS
jgi:hypothetical protein